MAKLHAATASNKTLLAGHREVPFLTVVAEGEEHVVVLDSDRSTMTEIPGVTKCTTVCAFFERLLADARKVDCTYKQREKKGGGRSTYSCGSCNRGPTSWRYFRRPANTKGRLRDENDPSAEDVEE